MRLPKRLLARILLWFLSRGLCACARLDSRAAAEVQGWKEGVRIALRVAPDGPAMAVEKREGRLRFLGARTALVAGEPGDADLLITFKHLDAALPILMGRKSIARGYAERRMTLRGDLTFAMSAVRVMLLVEAYLFPRLMARRIMQRVPARETSMLRAYIAVLLGA